MTWLERRAAGTLPPRIEGGIPIARPPAVSGTDALAGALVDVGMCTAASPGWADMRAVQLAGALRGRGFELVPVAVAGRVAA